MELDFSDFSFEDYGLTEGVHPCRIVEIEPSTTKAGRECYIMTLSVKGEEIRNYYMRDLEKSKQILLSDMVAIISWKKKCNKQEAEQWLRSQGVIKDFDRLIAGVEIKAMIIKNDKYWNVKKIFAFDDKVEVVTPHKPLPMVDDIPF